MKSSWLTGMAALGYLSTTKGDYGTAGMYLVLGVVFAAMGATGRTSRR